ncbi:MAG: MFS transporter [Chloroflexi bacterium]|nr:MFS transporter [Chloroflexota bacterium]
MTEEAVAGAPAATTATTKPKPFASLEYRDFRLLFVSSTLSSTGTMMRSTANAWQVYKLTDNPALLGLTFLFQGLPSIVVGLFGGTLADILPQRLIMRTSMLLELGLTIILAVLSLSGHIHVWHIYVLTLGSSVLGSIKGPASTSLIGVLVPQRLLLNASALQSTGWQSAFLAGPLLAGTLIDGVGPGWAYVVNGCMLAPAFVAVSMMTVGNARRPGKVRINAPALFEGLRFAMATRVLMAFVLLDTVTMVLGYYPAMMPVFAKDILHVGGLGLGALLAAAPAGSLLGLVVVLALGQVEWKGRLILVVTILHGGVLVAFAFSTWFGLSLVLIALLGLLDSMSVSVRQTSFQLLAKDENRGRVVGLVGIFAGAGNSLGGAYLGLAAKLMGPRTALAMGGALGSMFCLYVAAFWPRVRRFRA